MGLILVLFFIIIVLSLPHSLELFIIWVFLFLFYYGASIEAERAKNVAPPVKVEKDISEKYI